MNRKLYIRVDGNADIGYGHLSRTISLAHMVSDFLDIVFVSMDIPAHILTSIKIQGWHYIQIQSELSFIEFVSNQDLVLLDGYNFDTEYQSRIKTKGCILICIDDLHKHYFLADVVINTSPGASVSDYKCDNNTKLCLGLNYTLLRPNFLRLAKQTRAIHQLSTLFICFGGADLGHFSFRVLQSVLLHNQSIQKINVVITHTNPKRTQLERLATITSSKKITIYNTISEQEIIAVMQDSHIAIVPASNILFEVMTVKMPVLTGYYVDNQKSIYEGFKKLGMIQGLGNLYECHNFGELLDQHTLEMAKNMIKQQEQYLTGSSTENVKACFKTLLK